MAPIKKVVLITEVMSPYRIPVFNELAKSKEIELKVLFLAETVSGRSWKIEREKIQFKYRVLRGLKVSVPNRFPVIFSLQIGSILKEENPDILICGGYHHPSYWLALRYAKKHNKRFILWCESHADSVRERNFPADFYRKNFICSSDSFIVPGRKSFDFIRQFQTNGKRIWIAPNAVGNDSFARFAAAARLQAEEHKRQKGFPPKNILYVGRLVDSKGISVLLRAFQKGSKQHPMGLILVGEGKNQQNYVEFCRKNDLKDVFFEGFKQQEEVSYYYGLADLFVLPSIREEWGLVLNEAAASGLPLIATEASGAAFDLIDDGKNGFRVPIGNEQALEDAILKVLLNNKLRKSMAQYSLLKAAEFSPQNCAEGFLQAVVNEESKR